MHEPPGNRPHTSRLRAEFPRGLHAIQHALLRPAVGETFNGQFSEINIVKRIKFTISSVSIISSFFPGNFLGFELVQSLLLLLRDVRLHLLLGAPRLLLRLIGRFLGTCRLADTERVEVVVPAGVARQCGSRGF